MSNKVVTYIDMNLNSVAEYWAELVVPALNDYRASPSARFAFQASHSVWHLHDWVWHERNPGENSHGSGWKAYRSDLVQRCPELGWLRDVADAGKHRGLGRLPEVVGAKPGLVGARIGNLPLRGNRKAFFLVLNDGSRVDLHHILRAAVRFWLNELGQPALQDPFRPLAPKASGR